MGEMSELRKKIERLEQINEVIKENTKDKKKIFFMPRKIRNKARSIIKKNRVVVLMLKTNRDIEYSIVDIVSGFVKVKDYYYNARADCVWRDNMTKLPMLVLREWDMQPVGTKDFEQVVKEGRYTSPQKVLINFLEMHKFVDTAKKQISGKMVIFIIIGIVVVIYALSKGSLF